MRRHARRAGVGTAAGRTFSRDCARTSGAASRRIRGSACRPSATCAWRSRARSRRRFHGRPISPAAPRAWQRPWVAGLAVTLLAVVSGLVVWGAVRPAPPAPRSSVLKFPWRHRRRWQLRAPITTWPSRPTARTSCIELRTQAAPFGGARIGVVDRQTPPGHRQQRVRSVFSPDGAWVGFSDESDGTLSGCRSLAARDPHFSHRRRGAGIAGASWGEDGTIVFGTGTSGGLKRVAATGGEPEELTKLTSGQTQHAWPDILPGGRAVLFTIRSGGIENAQIAVLDLETGQQKVLLPGGTYPRYASTGHIVYAIGGALRAAPFDVKRLEITGTAVPILDRVIAKDSGAADFALAVDGSLVYLSGEVGIIERRLVWVDRMGREEPLAAPDTHVLISADLA